MDTGTIGEDLLKNFDNLDINIEDIDILLFTHKHYDHTGGALDFLNRREKRIGIIAHPEIFLPSFSTKPWKDAGIPFTKEEIESAGGYLMPLTESFEISSNLVISGEIKDREIEFERNHGYTRINNGVPEVEHHKEELAVYIVEGDKVHVISACSHSGIVNILEDAMKKTGKSKIGTVMGGFHFVGCDQKELEKHVNRMSEMDIEKIIAGHCTGFEGLCKLRGVFGEKFVRYAVGETYKIVG